MNWRKEVEDYKKELAPVPSKISCQAIKFGFFGIVGGGKSVTGGIFAIGITPVGKIGWVDGEGQRSGYAIDTIATMAAAHYGGTKDSWKDRFLVIHVDPPFHPLRVLAAMESLQEAGCQTVVMDIMSQAWDSEGGYLDLKETEIDKATHGNDAQRARHAQSAAAKIKPWTHQQLVNAVASSRLNLVLLFQGKKKWDSKSNAMATVDTPIQESGLTRTALAVGRVEQRDVKGKPQGGFCFFSGGVDEGVKHTHPDLLALLPANGEQMTFAHAQAVAKWVGLDAAPKPAKPADPLRAHKQKLLDIVKPLGKTTAAEIEKWLTDKNILSDTESLKDLASTRWPEVIEKAAIVANEGKD